MTSDTGLGRIGIFATFHWSGREVVSHLKVQITDWVLRVFTQRRRTKKLMCFFSLFVMKQDKSAKNTMEKHHVIKVITWYIARTRQAVNMVRTRQGTSLSRMLYSQRVREKWSPLFKPQSLISRWWRVKQLSPSPSSVIFMLDDILMNSMFGIVRMKGIPEIVQRWKRAQCTGNWWQTKSF